MPVDNPEEDPSYKRFRRVFYGVTGSVGAAVGYLLSAKAIQQPIPPEAPNWIEQHEQIVNLVAAGAGVFVAPLVVLGLFAEAEMAPGFPSDFPPPTQGGRQQ